MPDFAMCNQSCPVRFDCKRHNSSGTAASAPQYYQIYKSPAKDNPDSCIGWWPVNKYGDAMDNKAVIAAKAK